MDKILNVALVGCGNIAQNHLKALKSIPYIKVVALCDIKPERADKAAAEFGGKAYYDFDELIAMLQWGNFDILAHIQCPVRYMNGKYGEEATYRYIRKHVLHNLSS